MLASAKSKLIALAHALEGWFFERWIAARERFAAYEKGALARLHAEELKATLKALHFHVQDLEKRLYTDESAIAVRTRELLAKI